MNSIVSAAETFSDADLMSKRIEQDEEWTLLPIYEFLSMSIPSHPSGDDSITTKQNSGRLLHQSTRDYLLQICMLMLKDDPPQIKDVVDLLKSYHITVSDFNNMLKMRMDKYKLSSKIKASLTSQYNDD